MRHALRYTVLLLGIGTTMAIGWPVGAQGLTQQAIGFYLTVIGKPTVVHVGQPAAMPVKLRESVYFKDVIETQADSRGKALFEDGRILTGGENSRGGVGEYIYDARRRVFCVSGQIWGGAGGVRANGGAICSSRTVQG